MDDEYLVSRKCVHCNKETVLWQQVAFWYCAWCGTSNRVDPSLDVVPSDMVVDNYLRRAARTMAELERVKMNGHKAYKRFGKRR